VGGSILIASDVGWAASSWAFYPAVELTAARLPERLRDELELVSREHLGVLSLEDFAPEDARLVAEELLATAKQIIVNPDGATTGTVDAYRELLPLIEAYLDGSSSTSAARDAHDTCYGRIGTLGHRGPDDGEHLAIDTTKVNDAPSTATVSIFVTPGISSGAVTLRIQ
jgi:hypothetical protein